MAFGEPELLKRLSGGSDEEVAISRAELYEALEWFFPQRQPLHADLEVVAMKTIAQGVPLDAYELRIGEWQIALPARIVQSAVASSMLAGAIGLTGSDSVPVILLALVLPFLVDIERIELRTRDRLIRAYLKEEVDPHDPEAAYATLPEDIRAQLSLLEFADTLDRLDAAGMLRSEPKEPTRSLANGTDVGEGVDAKGPGLEDASQEPATIYVIEARFDELGGPDEEG